MNKKSVVEIKAYDSSGNLIEGLEMSYFDYYENTFDMIDSNKYRSSRGIAKIYGIIIGHKGNIQQKFVNLYNAEGELIQTL